MRATMLTASFLVLVSCDFVLAQETGTINGKVDNPYVRRSEAVVYIEAAPGEFKPPEENPKMDQRRLVFIPHVLPIALGTTVDFPNNDSVRHNVFSPPSSPEQFNLGTYSVGVTKQHTFTKVGDTKLLCNVHAEMNAYIIVCPTPYFAVVDKKTSEFTIEKVPAGKYKLKVWHERLRSKTVDVTVTAGETSSVTFSKLSRKR